MDGRDPFAVLPNELLHPIVADLCAGDVASLSRVSKASYSRFISRLYENVEIEVQDQTKCTGLHPAALFLRSIASNATPASGVHSLRFALGGKSTDVHKVPFPEDINSDWRTVFVANDADTSGDIAEFIETVKAFLSRFPLRTNVKHALQEGINHGNLPVVSACIILCCSQLRSLSIGSRLWCDDLDQLLSMAFQSHFVELIETIELNPDIATKHDVLAFNKLPQYYCLKASFELPNLLNLSVPLSEHCIKHNTLSTSNITQLDLKQTELMAAGLEILLNATPRLESLTYWLFVDVDYHEPCVKNYLNIRTLSTALSHVRNTLHVLSIAIWGVCWLSDQYGSNFTITSGRLTGLETFHQLEYLMIPFSLLTGYSQLSSATRKSDTASGAVRLADSLPTRLQTLIITDDLEEFGPEPWEDESLVEILDELIKDFGAIDCRPEHEFHMRTHAFPDFAKDAFANANSTWTVRNPSSPDRPFSPPADADDAIIAPKSRPLALYSHELKRHRLARAETIRDSARIQGD